MSNPVIARTIAILHETEWVPHWPNRDLNEHCLITALSEAAQELKLDYGSVYLEIYMKVPGSTEGVYGLSNFNDRCTSVDQVINFLEKINVE